MRIWVCLILGLGLAGCDRDPPAAAPPPKPKVTGVEVENITPLSPARVTHLAPAANGAIFWVQESQTGHDTVFAMTPGGVPLATTLTSAAVAQSLGDPAANGNIQSLAPAKDGNIYFYFIGGKGKKLLAAVGVYSPETGRTKILADTALLMSESGMGNSLALARGSILLGGDTLWIWLRHDDGYAILNIDLRKPTPKLIRAFKKLHAGADEMPMTAATEDFTLAADNTPLYLDRRTKKIWKISPLGEGELAWDLFDFPAGMTAPALDEKDRMVLFAPEDTSINELDFIPTTRSATYPALIIFDKTKPIVLPHTLFTAPAKTNIRSITLEQLIRDNIGWLGYDKQTGELLRLRVVQR